MLPSFFVTKHFAVSAICPLLRVHYPPCPMAVKCHSLSQWPPFGIILLSFSLVQFSPISLSSLLFFPFSSYLIYLVLALTVSSTNTPPPLLNYLCNRSHHFTCPKYLSPLPNIHTSIHLTLPFVCSSHGRMSKAFLNFFTPTSFSGHTHFFLFALHDRLFDHSCILCHFLPFLCTYNLLCPTKNQNHF